MEDAVSSVRRLAAERPMPFQILVEGTP
jgi:hypothetical protein